MISSLTLLTLLALSAPGAATVPASTAATVPTTQPMGCFFTAAPDQPNQAPVVRQIAIPHFRGAYGIFGSTGRDSRGHIWLGVAAHNVESPSAHLMEYVPATDRVIDHGDVLTQLKFAELYRKGEGQNKIHSRIVQGPDGRMYFASMDEQGENQAASKLPIWGSHLWRFNIDSNKWEHLAAAPEGLIAVGGGPSKLYALGYFCHRLYQYDYATGKVNSVLVGADGGHVSRNVIVDGHDHAYVPRLVAEKGKPIVAELVEYDAELRELAATPLENYAHRSPAEAHGIIGLTPMADGSIYFVTHDGWLSRLTPSAAGPAKLEQIGWFYPGGRRYSPSLFSFDGKTLLAGVCQRGDEGGFDWVVYDTRTGKSVAFDFRITEESDGPDALRSLAGGYVYGSITRDNDGNCYLGGMKESRPIFLQVRPSKPE